MRSSIPRVSGVSGSSADEDVGPRQQRVEAVGAMKAREIRASVFRRRLQPATLKPSACSLRAASSPSSPSPRTPTRTSRARRLALVLGPDLFLLLAVVAPELAVMQQDLQHHPFAHARGEVGIDDAHDRRVGQARIDEQMIDAGAEREDRFEVGQAGECAAADGASSARSARSTRSSSVSGVAIAWSGSSARRRSSQGAASQPVTASRMLKAPPGRCARRPARRGAGGASPMR